jgi:hypothetical protein
MNLKKLVAGAGLVGALVTGTLGMTAGSAAPPKTI